jgi:hypothetical protein
LHISALSEGIDRVESVEDWSGGVGVSRHVTVSSRPAKRVHRVAEGGGSHVDVSSLLTVPVEFASLAKVGGDDVCHRLRSRHHTGLKFTLSVLRLYDAARKR